MAQSDLYLWKIISKMNDMADPPSHDKQDKDFIERQPVPKWYLFEAALLVVTLVAFLVLIVLLIFG